jgi:hypothetical protein
MPGVTLPLTLADLDAAAGMYLILWAYRREQRDKPAVLNLGCMLVICALSLGVAGLRRHDTQPPQVSPVPATPGMPV